MKRTYKFIILNFILMVGFGAQVGFVFAAPTIGDATTKAILGNDINGNSKNIYSVNGISISTSTINAGITFPDGSIQTTAFLGGSVQTMTAGNISAGAFGSNTGGGNYSFPASLSVSTTTAPTGGVAFFNGNVGIGTAGPGGVLHIQGNSNRVIIGSNVSGGSTNDDSLKLSFFGAGSNTTITGPSIQKVNQTGYGRGDLVFYQHSGADYTSESEAMRLTYGGNVGIGTAAPDSKLHVSGTIESSSSASENHYYNVLSYYMGAANQTGALKITLPKYGSNTMLSIVIKGYNYTGSSGAWEAVIGGYNQAAHTWTNNSARINGRAPFDDIRLGNDGVNDVIILGTTSTVWAYSNVEISDVTAAYQNITGWDTGWAASLITSETGLLNISTLTINSYINTAGNFGIATTTPAYPLTVAGTIYSSTGGFRFPDGTTQTSAAGTGSQWTTSSTAIYYNTGSVGIGTTSPGTYGKLELRQTADSNIGGVSIGNSAYARAMRLWVDASNNSYVESGAGGVGNLILNSGTGKIGIATTTPTYTLDVNGAGDFNNNQIHGVASPTATTDAANKSYVDSVVGGGSGSGSFTTLSVSGTSTLAVTSGTVGVGTASPYTGAGGTIRLDVNGDIAIPYNKAMRFGDESTNGGWGEYIRNSSTGGGAGFGLAFYANSAEKMRIDQATGNVGIGTPAPGLKLSVQTATTNDGIIATDGTRSVRLMAGTVSGGAYNPIVQANDNAIIYTNNTVGQGNFVIAPWANSASGIRMDGSGNVGIGAASPTGLLTVGAAMSGTANSAIFTTNAGALGASVTNELKLASIGFTTGNSEHLGIYGYRTSNGADWTTTGIGLGIDVDDSVRVGGMQLFLHSNGYVGIGTASPGTKLDVQGGSIKTSGDLFADGIVRGAYTAASGDAFYVGNDSKLVDINVGNTMGIYGQTDSTVGSIKLGSGGGTISGVGGYIGIGTTNVVSQLQVYGSAGTGVPVAGGGALYLQDSGTAAGTGGALLFGDAYGNWAGIKGFMTDWYNKTVGDLAFYTRNATNDANLSERMRILANGNVGIGTPAPGGTLSINSTYTGVSRTANLLITSANNTNQKLYVGINSNGGATTGDYASIEYVQENQHWGPLALQADGGNVGIGTTAPASTLSVGGVGVSGAGVFGTGSNYGVYGQGGVNTGVYGTGLTGVLGNGSFVGVSGQGTQYGGSFSGSTVGITTNSCTGCSVLAEMAPVSETPINGDIMCTNPNTGKTEVCKEDKSDYIKGVAQKYAETVMRMGCNDTLDSKNGKNSMNIGVMNVDAWQKNSECKGWYPIALSGLSEQTNVVCKSPKGKPLGYGDVLVTSSVVGHLRPLDKGESVEAYQIAGRVDSICEQNKETDSIKVWIK